MLKMKIIFRKIGLLVWLAAGFCMCLRAQDFHLSQYFASPLAINPALAGSFDGLLRASVNYRNQWPNIDKAYVTTTAAIDAKIAPEFLPKHDAIGVGVLGNVDRVFGGLIATNQFSLAAAYQKALDSDGRHHLVGALQGTFSSKSLDFARLTFEDQYLPVLGGGTAPVPTGETFVSDNANYWEVNAGLLYKLTTNTKNLFYIGGSLYHINKPDENFMSYTTSVNRRYTAQGGGFVPLSGTHTMHFSSLYMQQGGSYEIIGGGALEWLLGNANTAQSVKLYTGLWWRVNDALIPYVGINWINLQMGVSYDINISNLHTSSAYKGGLELSLFYIFDPKFSEKSKWHCHCYYF